MPRNHPQRPGSANLVNIDGRSPMQVPYPVVAESSRASQPLSVVQRSGRPVDSSPIATLSQPNDYFPVAVDAVRSTSDQASVIHVSKDQRSREQTSLQQPAETSPTYQDPLSSTSTPQHGDTPLDEILHSSERLRAGTYPVLQDPKERPWWKGVVAYQIWPMSFQDSNGDGIGDIPGIISRLDYLKDLGIDVIWLSPTYESPMEDWGYDISDYENINERFGTLQDMENLIDEVHKRGMRILLDLVITHTSDKHRWFIESAKSKDNDKSDYYMWAERRPGNIINGELVEEPSNWRAAFGGSAWEFVPARDQYYIHLFLKSQPDLNWEDENMRNEVYRSAVKFWLDRGVDGFRLDTANRFAKHPKYPDVEVSVKGKWQPGSNYYMNGPKMHSYLKEIRGKIEKDSTKDIMIVGELPLTPYDELLKYVKPEEKELSMVFDFDVVKLGNNDNPDEYAKHEVRNLCDKDPSYTLPLFKTAIKKVQNLITDTNAWGTVFMENHDQPRSIARYATPEQRYWRKAGKLLATLQTTLSGTEFIYQGQEIGMGNMPSTWNESEFKDPDAEIYIKEYVDMHHQTDPNARGKALEGVFKVGRDNSRTPMQWSTAPNAGFTGSNPTWMRVNENYHYINVAAQQAESDSLWNFWKSQIALRKKYAELFMFGTFALYDYENERTMTYTKMATDGMMALVILNFSGDELPLNTIQRHLLGHTYELLVSNVAEPRNLLQSWEGRVYLVRKGLGEEGKEIANVGEYQDTHAKV